MDAAAELRVGSPAWRRTIWLPGCLSGLDARVVFANDTAALAEAAQLWNRLYSNSIPVAVVYPNTPAAVAAAVVCARKAGVRVVAKCVGRLALAEAGWLAGACVPVHCSLGLLLQTVRTSSMPPLAPLLLLLPAGRGGTLSWATR